MSCTMNSAAGPNELSAGSKLLVKFQNHWTACHEKSENIVIKACRASNKLSQLEKSSARQQQALEEFIASYKTLSTLEEQIKSIHQDLTFLEDSFLQIEDLLIVLKNNRENIETNRFVESTKANYELKVQELKTLSNVRKEKLHLEHLKRVQEYEMSQQEELDERRRVLEKAFEEEKSRYLKEKGKQT